MRREHFLVYRRAYGVGLTSLAFGKQLLLDFDVNDLTLMQFFVARDITLEANRNFKVEPLSVA